jgi:hypothetical protein
MKVDISCKLLAITLLFAVSCSSKSVSENSPVPKNFEGPIKIGTVTAGPFDLHRRYRSMEGPYASSAYTVEQLLSSPDPYIVGEDKILFVENGRHPSMNGGPSMSSPPPGNVSTGNATPVTAPLSASPNLSALQPNDGNASGRNLSQPQKRKLYWLKGITVEILDENERVVDSEFLCHINIDLPNLDMHQQALGNRHLRTDRVVTLSQGCSSFFLPEGTGFPIASDETLRISFQVANRTTDKHRRVKERVKFYLVPDSELVYPITALTWWTNFVQVVVDGNNNQSVTSDDSLCSLCLPLVQGVNAPNSSPGSVRADINGRRVSGHFVVPPGLNKYTTPWSYNDTMFPGGDLKVRCAWFHIHPFCESMSLIRYESQTKEKRALLTGHMSTSTARGLELTHIDVLDFKDGLDVPATGAYEVEVVYNNTSGKAQDSMASMGLYVEDKTFIRPNWAMPCNTAVNCAAPQGPSNGQAAPPLQAMQGTQSMLNQPVR